MTAVLSFVGLGVLLILGHQLRVHVRRLRCLFLPACVIGAPLVPTQRMLPDARFERGIAELRQSMGVTATGLLLLLIWLVVSPVLRRAG